MQADSSVSRLVLWRALDILSQTAALLANDIFSFKEKVLEGPLEFFKFGVSTQAPHDFMDFSVTASECSETGSAPDEGGKATLANLNFYVGTVITCFQPERSEEGVDYCQTLFKDTLSFYLPITLAMLVHHFGDYIK